MRRLKEETEKLGTMSCEELADLVNNMKKFNVDDIYDALYQAAIDVLHSDIPLGGKSRRFIALIFENQWNAFYDPKFDRQRKKILCGYDRGAEA